MRNPGGHRKVFMSLVCIALTASCAGEGPLAPEAKTGLDAASLVGAYDLAAPVMTGDGWHDLRGYRYSGTVFLEANPGIRNGLVARVEQLHLISPDGMENESIPVSSAVAFVTERSVVIEIYKNAFRIWRGSGVFESVRIRGTWDGNNMTGSFTAERKPAN